MISTQRPTGLAPYLHGSDAARSIYVTIFLAACVPVAAGVVFFGWRAAMLAVVCVGSCVLIERAMYRVSRAPALRNRSHAWVTGILLAATLPPFVPWYVAVIGSAFAILLGKAIFGGVGHFLWQPALVGRLAVAAMFASPLAPQQFSLLPDKAAEAMSNIFSVQMNPPRWPVLAQEKILVGDILSCQPPTAYHQWYGRPAPPKSDGFLLPPASRTLGELTHPVKPRWSGIARPGDTPNQTAPPVLLALPAVNDMLYGPRAGGIGETCAIAILIGGLFLIYRNYVKWQLPAAFLLAAAVVAALGPVYPQGVSAGWGPPGGWLSMQLPAGLNSNAWADWLDQWTLPPLLAEGLEVGYLYVTYQLLSGGLMLAAFFLATEMTCRPVTTGGQILFGAGCGAIAMLLTLYSDLAIPAYVAVLIMNTFSPTIDALWRPRVLGMRRRWFRLKPMA